MSNRNTLISCDYLNNTVFLKDQAAVQNPPFKPNWADQPSRFKIYQDVTRISLLADPSQLLGSVGAMLAQLEFGLSEPKSSTIQALSTLLQFSNGVMQRRLSINWNGDSRKRSQYHQAVYGRGTASGGGRYPSEIYWINGGSAPLLPGIYHYDAAHHAFARLASGQFTSALRSAVFDHPAASTTDQFLVLSSNFWKNSFKYNNFCYHVITQDIGAMLGSLRLIGIALQMNLSVIFWFQDVAINHLLGLDTTNESVFAIVPLPITSTVVSQELNATIKVALHSLIVDKLSFQRSKTIVRFPSVDAVHQAALIEHEPCPGHDAYVAAAIDLLPTQRVRIELPPVDLPQIQRDVGDVYRNRRSSFGRFAQQPPVTLQELATMLKFSVAIQSYTSDVKPVGSALFWTRVMLVVNNVAGLPQGVYSYDGREHCLWSEHEEDLAFFLQRNYVLKNYNLQEIGVVFAIIGRVDAMLASYGNRGYRILNAQVGMVAQGIYTAAAVVGIGCGAVLGMNNAAMDHILGLTDSDQRTLLFVLAGHERESCANFEYSLV